MIQWKSVSHCRRGLSHIENGTECQDRVRVYDSARFLVAALADGVGSKENAAIAAEETVKATLKWFGDKQTEVSIAEDPGQYIKSNLVPYVVNQINKKAHEKGLAVNTMDCNLAFVYIAKDANSAICGRLGDCAVCLIGDAPLAMTAPIGSANRTDTILNNRASERLELKLCTVSKQLKGFVLTSDGLDDIIYMKGYDFVRKKTETFFNTIFDSNPEMKLEKLISSIVEQNPSVDDDISIAILSKATEPICLENDPTWLCSCGHRNALHLTYCQKCARDMIKLYEKYNFAAFNGRYGFFRYYNQHPAEEAALVNRVYEAPAEEVEIPWKKELVTDYVQEAAAPVIPVYDSAPQEDERILDLHTTIDDVPENPMMLGLSGMIGQKESVDTTAGQSVTVTYSTANGSEQREADSEVHTMTESKREQRKQRRKNRWGNILLIGIVLVALLCNVLMNWSVKRSVEQMKNEIFEKLNVGEPGYNTADGDKALIRLDDDTYYYGEHDDGIPYGNGILITATEYQIGFFVNGSREGIFMHVDMDDPSKFSRKEYENDIVISGTEGESQNAPADNTSVEVVALYVILRETPSSGATAAGEIRKGESVYPVGTPVVEDEDAWIQIALEPNGEPVGWCRVSQTTYQIP